MCYSNTFVHRQKMLFWIDMTSDINASSVTPTKKRLWLVVSNDEINTTSSNLTAVPVYTRDEVTKDTHVAFKNGERDCVIVCEDIMSIPRRNIRPSNYAGFIDEETWSRVHNAIINQFSDNVPTNVRESINAILKDHEITNTIIDSIISIYRDNKDHSTDGNEVVTTYKPEAVINNSKVEDEELTINTSTDRKWSKHLPDSIAYKFLQDYDALINDKLSMNVFTKRYSNYINNFGRKHLSERARRIRRKLSEEGVNCATMGKVVRTKIPDSMIAQMYSDCNTLTYMEMNAKYPEYCNLKSNYDLSQKKHSLKKRLIASGIINIK